MGAEDLSPSELELARALREIGVSDPDWDGSVWVHDPAWTAEWERKNEAGEDPGTYGRAWVWIQDYALDWQDCVDNWQARAELGREPIFTHIPYLLHDATEGCVLGILRREEGMELAYMRPVRQGRGPNGERLPPGEALAHVQGWVAYVMEPDGAHAPIEPRGPIYGSAVEAAGRALLHLRAVRAASAATTSAANTATS